MFPVYHPVDQAINLGVALSFSISLISPIHSLIKSHPCYVLNVSHNHTHFATVITLSIFLQQASGIPASVPIPVIIPLLATKIILPLAQSYLTLLQPHELQPARLLCPGILQERILERVSIPFPRWSCQPRDETWVSRIAGRFFTIWTTRGLFLTLSYSSLLTDKI